jgi:hypothetical protein
MQLGHILSMIPTIIPNNTLLHDATNLHTLKLALPVDEQLDHKAI